MTRDDAHARLHARGLDGRLVGLVPRYAVATAGPTYMDMYAHGCSYFMDMYTAGPIAATWAERKTLSRPQRLGRHAYGRA